MPGKEKETTEKASYDYDVYKIQFTFGPDGVAASLPLSKSIRLHYAKLLQANASNQLKVALGNKDVITEEDILAYLEQTSVVFSLDEGGFYLREVQVISMILNAATRTKLTVMRKGVKGTLTQGTTFIRPKRLYLTNGGLDMRPAPLAGEPTLTQEESFPRNQQTGKSAPKSFQVLVDVKPIDIELHCLKNGDITPDEMKRL